MLRSSRRISHKLRHRLQEQREPAYHTVNHGLHFIRDRGAQKRDLCALDRQAQGPQAIARINARILRLSETGNFGDAKPVREGVSELRIDHGPGYGAYFLRRGATVVLLLAGGDKRTQETDIEIAIRIAKDWRG